MIMNHPQNPDAQTDGYREQLESVFAVQPQLKIVFVHQCVSGTSSMDLRLVERLPPKVTGTGPVRSSPILVTSTRCTIEANLLDRFIASLYSLHVVDGAVVGLDRFRGRTVPMILSEPRNAPSYLLRPAGSSCDEHRPETGKILAADVERSGHD